MSNLNRLESIANRQRQSRVRDLAFGALIAVSGVISLLMANAAR